MVVEIKFDNVAKKFLPAKFVSWIENCSIVFQTGSQAMVKIERPRLGISGGGRGFVNLTSENNYS